MPVVHMKKVDSDLPFCWGDIRALTAPIVLHTKDPTKVTCVECLEHLFSDYPGGGKGSDICQRPECGHIRGTHAPPTWSAPPGTQRCFCGCPGFVEKESVHP